MESGTKIKGLVAAAVTPMDARGEIDLGAIDRYANLLFSQGVTGIFVCGTTGEGLFLTPEERKRIAEAWMPYADRLSVLVHVGSASYKEAIALARHAESLGVAAISAMGPCYLPPKRAEELVAFNELIAREAPNTPYYYYHIPGTSGVTVDMGEFLRLAADRIPTLSGIKYTSYNTMEMQECIEFRDRRYNILHGHDETLLMGLVLGATGAIGTSYNVTGTLYNRLIAAFASGDLAGARELQAEANRFIRVLIKYVNSVVAIKAILSVLGFDFGPCRLPLRNLTADEMKTLEADLKSFDWL